MDDIVENETKEKLIQFAVLITEQERKDIKMCALKKSMTLREYVVLMCVNDDILNEEGELNA